MKRNSLSILLRLNNSAKKCVPSIVPAKINYGANFKSEAPHINAGGQNQAQLFVIVQAAAVAAERVSLT